MREKPKGRSEKCYNQAWKQYYIKVLICVVGFFSLVNNSEEDAEKNKKLWISKNAFFPTRLLHPHIRWHISSLLLFKILEGSRVAKVDGKIPISVRLYEVSDTMKYPIQSRSPRAFSLLLSILLEDWKHRPRANGCYIDFFVGGEQALLFSLPWPRPPNLSTSVAQVLGLWAFATILIHF